MTRSVAYVFLYKNGIKERSVGIIKRYGTAEQPEVALELFGEEVRKKPWEIYYFGKGGVLVKAAYLWGSTTEQSRSEVRITQCRLCAEAGAGAGVVLLPEEAKMQELREYLCARYDEKEVNREELREAFCRKPRTEAGENPCVETAKRLMEEIGKAAGGELAEENRTVPKKVRAIPASGPEKLLATKPSYTPCCGTGVTHSVRIVPEELRMLPETTERYGDNSYLMHGYYRYRHLLLGRRIRKEKEEYMILVPGTYDKKEARLAKQFGFLEFIPVAIKKPETGNAASGKELFGYFCGKI